MWHTNMDNMFYIWHIKPMPNATVTNKSCSFDAQQQGLSQYDFAQV